MQFPERVRLRRHRAGAPASADEWAMALSSRSGVRHRDGLAQAHCLSPRSRPIARPRLVARSPKRGVVSNNWVCAISIPKRVLHFTRARSSSSDVPPAVKNVRYRQIAPAPSQISPKSLR